MAFQMQNSMAVAGLGVIHKNGLLVVSVASFVIYHHESIMWYYYCVCLSIRPLNNDRSFTLSTWKLPPHARKSGSISSFCYNYRVANFLNISLTLVLQTTLNDYYLFYQVYLLMHNILFYILVYSDIEYLP